ncbi:MAG: 30S ribosomal protein S9 [Flavobacteriia bacterium]|jgi:small subunit ribosomal protein S9|nr:30S ribosomal protein S9 [Flavobacteriia bacterium]NBV68419.1 30S ribosomal protein S9 [Flavobacteriia bacterium]NBV91987.1 30S ribosomal protein S9 [Flavobacteriia bacterium]NBY41648.1 30S ribosomal protein S9 [Flavobacteriia bacterium]
MDIINALGRRKTAVARVYLSKGNGEISINNKTFTEFFPVDVLQTKVNQPFQLTGTAGEYNVKATVNGGGINGQAEAVRLGISRALVEINEEYKTLLRAEGLMTRDPRMVERKKPGQPKARKKFQFSKR